MSIFGRWRRVGFLACALIVAAVPAAAVTLRADSATVDAPGQRANLCVSLSGSGGRVAGTQNDLVWDGSCATLSSPGDCRIDASTGKQLQGNFPPGFPFTYRALVLSLSDVNPIPDGRLYCCAFTVEANPGQCCAVGLVRALSSDPQGNALGTSTQGGQLCVSGGDGTPRPTATLLSGGGSSGCAVGPPAGDGWLPLLGALALLAWRGIKAPRAARAQAWIAARHW